MKKEIQNLISNKLNINTKKYSLIIGSSPSYGARSPILWNKVYKSLSVRCKMYPADLQKKKFK